MNTDIRISVDFFSHHKTKRVLRLMGSDGVLSVVRLFCYAGKFRADGILKGMDAFDIANSVDWKGDPQEFVSTLCEIGFLEQCEDGIYSLHDWEHHNPWAAGAEARSLAASKAGKASAQKRTKSIQNATDVQRISTDRSTDRSTDVQRISTEGQPKNGRSTPSPSPSPSPSPKDIDSSIEESCPTQSDDSVGLALMDFPLSRKGTSFPVTQKDVDQWQESFPGVDVIIELKACRQWNIDNPTKRKTSAGIRGHISRWLGKAQNSGRSNGLQSIAPQGQNKCSQCQYEGEIPCKSKTKEQREKCTAWRKAA